MNRFTLFVVAAALAFVAGWLFGNEMKPPRYEDLSLAAWLVAGVAALGLGAMASAGRG